MALGWYVIRTEPRAEYLAVSELGRDGFEVFFPRVNTAFHRLGHTDTPLFPGYIFLRWDPENEGWPSFRLAHRVSGWVSFEGVVPVVPDEVITELSRRVDEITGGEGLWRRFRRGEKVRVVSSTLDSLGEVVEEAKSPHARAKVLLQFMGRLVQAQVPWDALQPLEEHPVGKQRFPRRTRGKGRWTQEFRPRQAVSG